MFVIYSQKTVNAKNKEIKMDKYIDVPNVSGSQEDVVIKQYDSSASVTNVYTETMSRMKAKINSQPLTSDINKIN